MKLKPGNTYEGKVIGEFDLLRIKNDNGKPVFIIATVNHHHIELSLEQMREESPKVQ
jgi:vancomycin resistance protein YoaR